jgi:DNA-binding NarL/FixJ family response regulator
MGRVLVIDDHPIVLQGCRRVLEDAGIEPVLEAANTSAGYRLYLRHRPKVVIIDLGLEGSGLAGLTLIRRIRAHDPLARILVFSMHSEPTLVSRALDAGATGYLLKDTSADELIAAYASVERGRPYLSDALARQIALSGPAAFRDPLGELTPRERDILKRLADGKSYGLIAQDLGLSYKTVVNVCYQLRQKLELRTLPELIRAAVRLTSTSA